ncbi:unnamed protein product [Diatraea saccharalis]|uniref:MADF domain-containing protein n=1 Tax=Diatraea saccharalis TaxID=40085 RepID=A0A9N9RAD0_9NEOP|nr:unnamed protein product [Diatraea saccharalis]
MQKSKKLCPRYRLNRTKQLKDIDRLRKVKSFLALLKNRVERDLRAGSKIHTFLETARGSSARRRSGAAERGGRVRRSEGGGNGPASGVTTAKCRWKQLRDNHRDALKRQNATRSGQARRQRKEWKYQNAMSFLLPYTCNRDRASNFESLEDSANKNSNQPNTDDSSQELNEARDKYDEIEAYFLNLAASTIKLIQLQIKKKCFNAVMIAEETNLQQSWYSPNNNGYSTSSTPTSDNINISNNAASSSHVEETETTTEHFSNFPLVNNNMSTATAPDFPETQNAGTLFSTFPQVYNNISTATVTNFPETQNTGNNQTLAVELSGSDEDVHNNMY